MENYESPQGNGKQLFWILGGVIIVIMIIGIVYSATQKTLKNTEPETRESDTSTTLQKIDPVTGKPISVKNQTEVPATITGLDIVRLSTFPQRVQMRITGTVPDGCSTFNTPTIIANGKTFNVTVTASHDADQMCTQVVTNQEIVSEIPVAGLGAGTYSVTLGSLTKTFTLVADNNIEFFSDK